MNVVKGVIAAFLLIPALIYNVLKADASGPNLVPLRTAASRPEHPHFGLNPAFQREQLVSIQLVLTMMGASSFNEVMVKRNSSKGANSKNVIVAFSIMLCDRINNPYCTNRPFLILEENPTNFTVEGRLVTNSDLDSMCLSKEHLGRVGYIEYPGLAKRPNGTAEYDNYFVVFKCGTFVNSEFFSTETRKKLYDSLWAFVTRLVMLAVVLFSIICTVSLAYYHHRRKNPRQANPEEPQNIEMDNLNEDAAQPAAQDDPVAGNQNNNTLQGIRAWLSQFFQNSLTSLRNSFMALRNQFRYFRLREEQEEE